MVPFWQKLKSLSQKLSNNPIEFHKMAGTHTEIITTKEY
ncbi:hypothetical protein LEP1GSC007_0811 [Leptospira interrogans serovar Bulgarica str. Mallika]|nr:hypothetical protein LEP1GSC007_0811 [Leptospira interrogans serovar Bulgarica str. Mallika]